MTDRVKCRCKLCQAWFPYDALVDIGDRKACPVCRLSEGVEIQAQEGGR